MAIRMLSSSMNLDEIAKAVGDVSHDGDMVVCLGAGNITNWAQSLPHDLDELRLNANNAAKH